MPDDQSLVMLSLENLSPDTMYYINVVPLDPENLNVEIGNLKSDEISFTTPSIQPAIAASTPVNNFLTTKPTSNPATKSTPAMTTKTFVDYTRRPVDKNVTIQSINKRSDDEFGWVSRTTHYKSFPAYLDKKDLGKAKKSIFEPVSYAQRMALV